MAGTGPFEPAPRLAVAVSGGSDSLATAVLAAAWAESCGGTCTAVTVDHGLRAAAPREADAVGARLATYGVAHRRVAAAPPGTHAGGVEADARLRRYAALAAVGQDLGCLHLLLGHTADDQAETVLLRLGHGSGPDGLAGMPLVTCRHGLRLVRPLLGCRRQDLQAFLRAHGLGWAEDPMNTDTALARGRLRQHAATLAAVGLTPPRLSAAAARAGADRAGHDRSVAGLAAEAIRLDGRGVAEMAVRPVAAAPDAVGRRLLSRVLAAVGGRSFPPAPATVARLHAALVASGDGLSARSAGGCVIAGVGDGWLRVWREPGRIGAAAPVPPDGHAVLFDGRFQVWCRPGDPAGLRVAALTPALWGALRRGTPGLAAMAPPGRARFSLPVLVTRDGRPWDVPPLSAAAGKSSALGWRFAPAWPLAPAPWTPAPPAGQDTATTGEA